MRALVVLFASAVPATALARQSPDTTVLRPVVISATRAPMEKRSAPASVTVISGDELRARGITTVSEALASVPGLAVVQSGSFGATTSLFARGGESDYVKVLVDGVPLNNPGGSFDFATLTTNNLERIEVVRGPASVVYGSDAVAGVVQLFTRRGAGPPRGTVDVRAGSYGTMDGSANVAGGSAQLGFALGAASHQTDGIHDFNNDFRNRTLSARVSFAPGATSLDLTGRRTDARYHFPTDGSGVVVDSNAVRRDGRTVLGLAGSRRLTSALNVSLIVAASRLDGGSSNQPDSPGDTTGFYGRDDSRIERRSVDLRTNYRAGSAATVSLGAAVEREQTRNNSESQFQRFPSSTASFAAHRTNEAAYAELIGTPRERLTYTVSGRVDDNATYGAFVTGRASVSWEVVPQATLRAAVGNAFKAPMFDETFSSTFTIGNPDLDPERTTSWEAAAEYRIGTRVALSATYFDQRFRDLIQYVFGDETTEFRGTNANLAGASARGLELEAHAPRLGAVDLGANVTLLRTRVTDAGNGAFGTFVNDERLLRRPAQTASATAGYTFAGSWRLGVGVRYIGERDDRDFANEARVTLPSYTLLDLRGEVGLGAVTRSLTPLVLTLRVENAFDRDYEPTFGFAAPGRTVLIGGRAAIGGR
jgi:vitamin B12 transporter